MPLDLARFATARPYLYHLTAATNLAHIERTKRLESASVLLERAGRRELVRERRRDHVSVALPGGAGPEPTLVHIRDQAPLHAGNVRLEGGWNFADLVTELNRRVYFWPGKVDGPSPYGCRHFQRYAAEDCVVLVVRTDAVLSAAAEFSCCNSGSPRCNPSVPGYKAPRGPRTFLNAASFEGSPGNVIEVVFPGGVDLPWNAVHVARPDRWVAATRRS